MIQLRDTGKGIRQVTSDGTGTGYRGSLGIQEQDTGKVYRDRILRQDTGIGNGQDIGTCYRDRERIQ
jgi:hypothetical protein